VTGSIEPDPGPPTAPRAGRSDQPLDPGLLRAATRSWWDGEASDYQARHGEFLGDVALVWGPEGLTEAAAGLLGPVPDRRVLEVGAGAAAGARWLRSAGADAVAVDLSGGQLAQSALADRRSGVHVPAVQADAAALPFAAGAFDLVVAAYGALPFAPDDRALHAEVARVLRPGGRWVFSVPHPLRWAFPDVPGPDGLTARFGYFDRRPYVESDADGVVYAEYHRTLGDHVRSLVASGFVLADLVEPEWPDGHERAWGGWSPLRGRLLPGTAIFVAERAGPGSARPTG
jgi:SAM-dependent methyltransferase